MSRNTRWSLALVVLLSLFALLVGGCGDASTPLTTNEVTTTAPTDNPVDTVDTETTATTAPPGDTLPAGSDTATTSEPTPPPPSGGLDALAAVDAALAAVPDGTVLSVDRDTHHGQPVWEVVVRTPDGHGIELDIDVASGAILKQEPETLHPYELDAAITVDIGTAIAEALSLNPGTLHEAELTRLRDGRLMWEIEIIPTGGHKVEHWIDVVTGNVIR